MCVYRYFCFLFKDLPISKGVILPKQTLKVTFQIEIDDNMAAELNAGSPALQTTLIVHLEHGLDYFVAISGSFGE